MNDLKRPEIVTDRMHLMGCILKLSIIGTVGLLFMLLCFGKWSESEQEELPPAMVKNPNNPAIDYDWDRGVYIYASDTAYLEKDPFRRTWVPKGTLKKVKQKQTKPLPKEEQEEVWKQEQALEDLGDDAYEYYR